MTENNRIFWNIPENSYNHAHWISVKLMSILIKCFILSLQNLVTFEQCRVISQSSSPSSSRYTWAGWDTSVLSLITGSNKSYIVEHSLPKPYNKQGILIRNLFNLWKLRLILRKLGNLNGCNISHVKFTVGRLTGCSVEKNWRNERKMLVWCQNPSWLPSTANQDTLLLMPCGRFIHLYACKSPYMAI